MQSYAVLCCAVLCSAVPCCAVPCRAVPCRAVPCRAVPCYAIARTSRLSQCSKGVLVLMQEEERLAAELAAKRKAKEAEQRQQEVVFVHLSPHHLNTDIADNLSVTSDYSCVAAMLFAKA